MPSFSLFISGDESVHKKIPNEEVTVVCVWAAELCVCVCLRAVHRLVVSPCHARVLAGVEGES